MKLQRMTIVVLAASILSGPTAQAVEPWGLGIGVEPCSNWTRIRDSEALPTIFGFWSALNYVALVTGRNNGHIGEQTGQAAVVAEVRQACQVAPSVALNQAILSAYDRVRLREAGQAR